MSPLEIDKFLKGIGRWLHEKPKVESSSSSVHKGRTPPKAETHAAPKREHHEGHIAMKKPVPTPEASKPQAEEPRQTIEVQARAKDLPAGRRLEVFIEESGKNIDPQMEQEVRSLARMLNEKPSETQWENIQNSVRQISSYSDADAREIAKVVRSEVHQYAFYHIVAHAKEYGLGVDDAQNIASTFRYATVARFRAEQKQAGQQVALLEVQRAMESALVKEEIDHEWETVSEIVHDASQRPDTEETGKRAMQLRETEDISVEDAKARIRELIRSCPEADGAWMKSLLDKIHTNKDAAAFLLTVVEAGPDALSNPAYLFAKGTQWRVETYSQLMNTPRGESANEVRAIQNAFARRVAEVRYQPATVPAHAIDFSGIDKSLIDANVRFEGTFGGVSRNILTKREWWARDDRGHNGVLYDEAHDIYANGIGPVANPLVKGFLEEVQKRMDAPGSGGAHNEALFDMNRRFDDILREMQRKNITPESNTWKYKALLDEQVRAISEMRRDFMDFGASAELKERIWIDGPQKVAMEFMRDVEKYSKSYLGDSFEAENAMKKLKFAEAYITDDRFIDEYRRYLRATMRGGNGKPVKIDVVNEIVNTFKTKTLHELSWDIDTRKNMVSCFNASFARGVTAQKMSELLSPVGSEGLLTVLGYYDGRVAAAFDYMDGVLMSEHRAQNTNDKVWLSTDNIKAVYRKAIVELRNGAVADLADLPAADIDEIAFLAQEVSVLTGRPVLAMDRGLSSSESGFYDPILRPEMPNPFAAGAGSNLERWAGARKFVRFDIDRWMQANKGTEGFLEDGAMLAAKGDHVGEAVKEMIESAQKQGSKGLEDLVRHLCCISEKDVKDTQRGNPPAQIAASEKVIRSKLAHFYLDHDLDGNPRLPPETIGQAAKNVPLLQERLEYMYGIHIFERAIMDYTTLDGSPVYDQTIAKIHEMFDPKIADTLAISMKVRKAYAGVLGANTPKGPDGKITKISELKPVLEEAAKYNPVDLLNGHVDNFNQITEDWFGDNTLLNQDDIKMFLSPNEIAANGVKCSGDLIKALNRRLVSVESLIKREVRNLNGKFPELESERQQKLTLCSRINWQNKASIEAHRNLISKALASPMGKAIDSPDVAAAIDGFIRVMESVSNHVGGSKMIDQMTLGTYLEYGMQTQNTVDCWLDLAQQPQYGTNYKLDELKEPTIKKLSQQLGERGSGDVLIRSWGDQETATMAKDVIKQAIKTQDWKLWLKAVSEIQTHIRSVYGAPWDGRSILYLTGGLLKSIGTDKFNEWTYGLLDFLHIKSSKIRRLLNSEHAASASILDRYEMVGELENLVNQSLESYDKELAELYMEYVGLKIGGIEASNGMVWAKRASIVAGIILILLAVEAGKQGKVGLADSTGGGGGAGGQG